MNRNINSPPPAQQTQRIAYTKSLSLSFTKIVLLLLFLFFTSNTFAVEQEWLMRIIYGGAGPTQAKIMLYQYGVLIDSGYSANTWIFNPGGGSFEANVGADVNSSPGSGDSEFTNPTPTWSIKDPGSYTVRVIFDTTDRYFDIYIPNAPGGDNDFNIEYNIYDGSVSYKYNGRGLTPSTLVSYAWVEHNITVKNSFNAAGDMNIDYTTVSIPNGGKTYNWPSPSFPHHLGAIDQQPAGIPYMQRFEKWTGNSQSSNRTISIDTVDATYTAKFLDEYNIMFQNSFSDATGGVINVNGSQTAPYQTVVLENDGITATAVSQGIDNITYYFTNWSTGSTNINETFYPISDTTIAANFVGIAAQSINLNFESSDPNLPITLHWTEYPNNNVTQYQIWRRIKYKKNPTEDPVLLATVNRGTTSYIDYDFYGTNLGYTDWMLWYDVRSYYSTEGTYPDPNWAQVFSGGLIREKPTDLEEKLTVVKENSLDNFPNPFNPSTVIQYQIVESGFVSVKVYDNLGREVDVLVNKEQQSGKYSVAFDASKLASGIYFYTINAKDFYKVKKMILLR